MANTRSVAWILALTSALITRVVDSMWVACSVMGNRTLMAVIRAGAWTPPIISLELMSPGWARKAPMLIWWAAISGLTAITALIRLIRNPEKASAKSHAYSLDVEVGHRVDLDANWFIEPQAEITWLRSQKAVFVTDKNTQITLGGGNNLDLRLGFTAGKTVHYKNGAYQMYGKLDHLLALSSSNNILINDTWLNSKKKMRHGLLGPGCRWQKIIFSSMPRLKLGWVVRTSSRSGG